MQLPDSPQQNPTLVEMEDKKPVVTDAEDVMMQYPSPADGPDAQFYHLSTREQVLAQQVMAQQVEQEQANQADLDPLQDHPEHQENQHHNLHELQELQDSPTQHHNTTIVSVDELQLAAQLTQGLTQIAAAQQQDHEQESQLHSQEDVEMQHQGDANLHEQLQAQLQNHDQMQSQQQQMQSHEEMQAHDQLPSHEDLRVHEEQMKVHQALQAQHQQLQAQQEQLQNHDPLQNHEQLQGHEQMQAREHDLQEVLSHAEQSQVQHLYGQGAPQPQHGQSLTPIDGLPHSPYPLLDANTPPRKRSKVSRACDECRRKKIKCDAQSEPGGGQPCSNCRRAGAQCLFSRVPQKRGPSKGYIKELADRINNIEGKFGISKEDSAARRPSAEAYASPTPGDESRKRPYASISVDGYAAPSPGRQSPWVTEHKPIRPYNPEYRPPYSVNDLAPKPEASTPLFLGSLESIPQTRTDGMEGITQNGVVQGGLPVDGLAQDDLSQDLQQAEKIRDIDDVGFDVYLNMIHRTLPVLSSSKSQVQFFLEQCPVTLQNAFLNAFYALLKPFIQPDPDLDFCNTLTANKLLHEWEMERRPHTLVTNLVHLQTLIMMIIEADYHGLASIKGGQAAGPPKSSTLPRAVGVGISMKLYITQPDPTPGPEFNPDSIENVAIRAWWTLVMLDRWNAIGTASLSLISNDNVVVFPGLRYIVGDVVFLFIKISYYMGLFTPLGIRPSLDPFGDSPPIIGSFGNAIAESVRWQFPVELDDVREPGLHLAYWHFRLLAQLFSISWRPELALQCCKKIAGLLLTNNQLVNPLTHHFISLCSLILIELTNVDVVRKEAMKLAKDLADCAIAPSAWNGVVKSMIAEKLAVRPTASSDSNKDATQRETSQTLQQLADLAASVEGTLPMNSESTTTQDAPSPPQEQDPASTATDTAADETAAAETFKEELLDSIKGLEEEQQLPPPAPAATSTDESSTRNHNHNTTSTLPELQPQHEQKPLDPQAILRSGYLAVFTAFEEHQEQEHPEHQEQPPQDTLEQQQQQSTSVLSSLIPS